MLGTTLDDKTEDKLEFPDLAKAKTRSILCAEGDYTYVRYKKEKQGVVIYCGMNNYMCKYAGENVGGIMLCNALEQSKCLILEKGL